ncbi:sterol desaturase family protein [Shimia haliotis]|uniref:Sterol desaturase/sphingolipid hydroxylase, fatty acid hydroxylase superfamily n=1 Tax=Shimia haliotis TaxID=1280847 RepID=A0A1I4ED67_9RHOB|nr:sterol desaturase family protein [Shimia haliotis]SFL02527.1 Sterol desaturase/sphingolipid hydroxylase, fatty acid hydroxylase superfamily [Shimia haliotis]
MTPEAFMALAEQIDEVFFTLGGLILVIEIAEAWFKGSLKGKTFLEMLASASTQVPYLLLEVTMMTALYFGLYVFSETVVSWHLPSTLPWIVLAIVLADFTYYWEHRIAHQVRLLWTQHAVHHSSRDYNIITSIRFGPLESLWSFIAHIPMILIGFSPDVVLGSVILVQAYQTWLHTELIGKLGPLEWVLNTPSHHRVHHGCDNKYLDKNYGGISIIWDRMFGSFQVEEERPRYGLTTDFDSQNPVKVWFSEIPALWKDIRNAKSGRELRGRLFGPPGWKPDP